MKIAKIFLSTLAVASLVSGPVMAGTLSPSTKSAGNENVKRIGTKAEGEKKRRSGLVYGAIAAAAIIGGVIALSSNDKPASP